jgi:ferredoxin
MRPIPEYKCEICNYTCSVKRIFNQHLRSLIHRSAIGDDNEINFNTVKCHGCGGVFGSRTSLWRHKRTCTKSLQKSKTKKACTDADESLTIEENEDTDSQTKKADTLIDKAILMEVLKETKILRQAFEEQTKTIENLREVNERQHKIIEEKLPLMVGSTTNNTTNNITNVMNSPNFNINVFLNEQCKNAINLSDFVQSIVVKIEDLEKTKNIGYVKGVTDIIVKNLRELDIYSRPIHCSDPVQEILYIKNDNIWSQDKDDKPMVRNAISVVAKKQLEKVKDWEEQNPTWVYSDKGATEYIKMVRQVTSSHNDEESKIMKNIAREVIIKTSQ